MRLRGLKFILVGILSIGLFGCHPPKRATPERPPVEPPPGWRIGRQQDPRRHNYRATFVPKQRTAQEKMWVTILRQPDLRSKSIDELLATFRPAFICQSRDLNVLKKDHNDILFEEKDAVCYGKTYRYTIGRVTRGKASVSYYAYRADVPELPEGRRDFVLKAISSAPLDSSGSPQPEKSVAASASPSAGVNSR
jgi:hypothetical protein